ncbi:TVP38 TMEM64 family membrane protein [Musa troglodytarum]|uniref:TVP38 TMEM64 family membrane protein n=1 Tax=Musa troglodytarum TaxID=320322 RepID=A0A9E7ENI6_9LILI|nr:TVP38 TMEM64 family membrane protein [Musa troglodytarum]
MTYRAQDVENIVVLDAKLSAGEVNGDYVRLGDGEPRRVAGVLPQCPYRRCNSVWWWIRVVLLCVCLFAAAVPLIIFAGPLIIKKRWLEKWPKKAAIVKLAAVATNVEYGPYISGSLVGTIHETFITIYSGRLLQSLADATNTGGFLSLEQYYYHDYYFHFPSESLSAEFPFLMEETRESGDCFAQRLMS